MKTTTPPPKLAYLVSVYPAISHTFILREILRLRELGHQIVTASINRPDREVKDMDSIDRKEAENTYCIKADSISGAVSAFAYWLWKKPSALWTTFREGFGYAHGRSRLTGLAYAVEAIMVGRWMTQENCRHLHVHFGNAGATVGMLTKTLTGCHLSYTIHGPDEFDDVPGQYLKTKISKADRVICISQYAMGQLMRISSPENWPKLQRCRLGVNPERFEFKTREYSSSQSQIPQILSVGRLTPAKCQVLLVQACAILRNQGKPFHLTIVGAGPDLNRVMAAIAEHHLQDHVSLTGALTQEGVRKHLNEADVFALPSLAEGIPVVLMEAMASGVPCVSSPVNGIPELIEHGKTGLLALPGDAEDIAKQLSRLIDDPALRKELACAARKKLLDDFDLDVNVDRLSSIFRSFPTCI